MKVKIDNQELYEARIKYFKENYFQDFKEKVSVPGCDKAYVKERFKRDVLELRLNEIFNLKNIKEAYHFRNKKKSLNGIKAFKAVKQFCEEEKSKKDFQLVLEALAEHDAILNIHNELNIDENENQNQPDNKKELQGENNTLKSIIENKFKSFKDEFNNENDYFEAIKLLETFFLSGKFSINKPLFVKSGNIKSFAFALGEIWRSNKNKTITYEYLSLYKQSFSIFKDQKINKKNIFGCNLYKYSISKA